MQFKIQKIKEIPLDYTELFVGVLVTTITPHQQSIDVYLQDKLREKLIKIGSIIDKNMSLSKCREGALNMLNNEEFCFAHYQDLLNKEMNEDN